MEIVPLYTHLEEAGTTRIRIILLQKDDLQRCTGGSREKHYQMIFRIKKRCVRECTYNRPRKQVRIKKIAVQSLGGYFCDGFQRSGNKSRYFSIGVFGGHAAQQSKISQK